MHHCCENRYSMYVCYDFFMSFKHDTNYGSSMVDERWSKKRKCEDDECVWKKEKDKKKKLKTDELCSEIIF